MSNKYFAGNKGQYIYCDICGQCCYAFEATRLGFATGRGGLIVCPNDVDNIDYSTMPIELPTEKRPSFVRINHTETANGAAPIDYENTTF